MASVDDDAYRAAEAAVVEEDPIKVDNDFFITRMLQSNGVTRNESIHLANDQSLVSQILHQSILYNAPSQLLTQEQIAEGRKDEEKSLDQTNTLKVFTVDSALNQIGGFGRFQFLTMILLTILRNYGQLPVYIFEVCIEKAEYECRSGPTQPWADCSIKFICDTRKLSLDGFEWQPKTGEDGYSYNWFVDNDMMCENQNRVNSIVSAYFFGYFIGVFFFFMPNTFGRKPSMMLSLTFYTLGSGLIAYGNSIDLKFLGYFLLGVFHLKITLSY